MFVVDMNSDHFPVILCVDLYELFVVNFHRTYAGRLMLNEKRIIFKSSDTRIIVNIWLFTSFIFKAFGFKTLLLLILADPCSNPVDYKISIAYRYLFVRKKLSE